MKVALFVSSLLCGYSAMACPDFSGDYVQLNTNQDVSIYQTKCESIAYVSNGGKASYTTDGQERLVWKYDIEGAEEGSVIAHVEIYQSRAFEADAMTSTGRAITTYVDDGKTEVVQSTSRSYFDESKNIVVETKYADGSSSEDTFVRVGK